MPSKMSVFFVADDQEDLADGLAVGALDRPVVFDALPGERGHGAPVRERRRR
jgi:hypothetical protein